MTAVSTVAAALRRLREARNLSLAETARRADVSRASLHNWEDGVHAPPGPALERVLCALRADPRERAALLASATPRYAEVSLAGEPLGPPIGQGALLRAMRGRKGLTQKAVALAMGVTQSAVAKWESGDSAPSEEALGRLLGLFGATPEEATSVRRSQQTDALLTIEGAKARLLDIYGSDQSEAEPMLLAQEAEIWRRAVCDPHWEPVLVQTMAYRSYWLGPFRGRRSEGIALARRALKLAERTGAWDEAALAYRRTMEYAPDDYYTSAMVARDLRRAEAFAGRLVRSETRAYLRTHHRHLTALGEASPGAVGEHYGRVAEGLLPSGTAPGAGTMDRVEGNAHLIAAYLWLGRFDEADRLEAETPWHRTNPRTTWISEEVHAQRLLAYLKFDVHPTAGELRRAEGFCAPDLRGFVEEWARRDRNRKHWRAYLNT